MPCDSSLLWNSLPPPPARKTRPPHTASPAFQRTAKILPLAGNPWRLKELDSDLPPCRVLPLCCGLTLTVLLLYCIILPDVTQGLEGLGATQWRNLTHCQTDTDLIQKPPPPSPKLLSLRGNGNPRRRSGINCQVSWGHRWRTLLSGSEAFPGSFVCLPEWGGGRAQIPRQGKRCFWKSTTRQPGGQKPSLTRDFPESGKPNWSNQPREIGERFQIYPETCLQREQSETGKSLWLAFLFRFYPRF